MFLTLFVNQGLHDDLTVVNATNFIDNKFSVDLLLLAFLHPVGIFLHQKLFDHLTFTKTLIYQQLVLTILTTFIMRRKI